MHNDKQSNASVHTICARSCCVVGSLENHEIAYLVPISVILGLVFEGPSRVPGRFGRASGTRVSFHGTRRDVKTWTLGFPRERAAPSTHTEQNDEIAHPVQISLHLALLGKFEFVDLLSANRLASATS